LLLDFHYVVENFLFINNMAKFLTQSILLFTLLSTSLSSPSTSDLTIFEKRTNDANIHGWIREHRANADDVIKLR
jgi:hypothetical protein